LGFIERNTRVSGIFCTFICFFSGFEMKKIFLLLVFVLFAFSVSATHQRAGEITYTWISAYKIQVTIVTYTYSLSLADRPELTINWGDGTSDVVQRIGQGVPITAEINKNTYTYDGPGTGGIHTYAGPGTFVLSMEDPNRNYGIQNIPNSVNVPFYLQTVLVINPFLGPNSSPILQNPPIDNACVNEVFIHNPWAYDPDGDSLSYRLDTCMTSGGMDIIGFSQPAASHYISVDPITGDLVWDSPMMIGEYNVAILIQEWRDGHFIGSVLRDLQITVVACNNHPPQIADMMDTCVLAGDSISIPVTATDPDNDVITLTGNGGPLILSVSPAHFDQPVTGTGTVSSNLTWRTDCAHVRKNPYQVNFKATDDGAPVHLVDFNSLRITVVAPAPQNLTATTSGINIQLNWNKSICENAIGYRIYRRNGYYGYFPSHCETGVPAYTGYSQIAQLSNLNDTSYLDNNGGEGLLHGIDYCYMVIAYFADGAESYASLEACAILKKDVPVITHVSVTKTSTTSGIMYIDWSKPTEFDTVAAPGPYKYLIYRAPQFNGGTFTLIDSLSSINDTVFIDSLINTTDLPYRYRVDLWNDSPGSRFLIGASHHASSVFLTLLPTDNEVDLKWNFLVPWENMHYVVYRYNDISMLWDSIATTDSLFYADMGLVNGTTYCYKVKSIGSYSATGYVDPIENFSQESCAVPIDNVPPCPPVLTMTTDCNLVSNYLSWTNPNHFCTGDVAMYQILYSPDGVSDYSVLATINNPNDTLYVHNPGNTIIGCYTVIAIDSNGNQSNYSNVTCADIYSCDIYQLPDVFTPNGDGRNDFFIPFPYDFVEKVDMVIFNRWGGKVFTTHDPDINWNGNNQFTKQPCSDGVYYFVCVVYEQRLEGIVPRTISGIVHLLR
jgi:gliding motility-associated-like protein